MSPSQDVSPPLPRLAPRQADSNKGDYGRLLIVGGSQGMAGAVALSGMAALRSGAGLVKLATAAACQATVASFEPSAMTLPLPCDGEGRIASSAIKVLEPLVEEATVVACGPGLGRSEELKQLVGWLYQRVARPMVCDADALFALAKEPELLKSAGGPRVLTPHPGEFSRLLGVERFATAERESLAKQFAKRTGAVVLLKGHRTVITDGSRVALNTTGNPGMATGGTGDVLTGVIAALLGQGLGAFEAAQLGAYVHGLAGDLAAAELGEVSMIASDLVRFLPEAWQSLSVFSQ